MGFHRTVCYGLLVSFLLTEYRTANSENLNCGGFQVGKAEKRSWMDFIRFLRESIGGIKKSLTAAQAAIQN